MENEIQPSQSGDDRRAFLLRAGRGLAVAPAAALLLQAASKPAKAADYLTTAPPQPVP